MVVADGSSKTPKWRIRTSMFVCHGINKHGRNSRHGGPARAPLPIFKRRKTD